MPLVFVHGVNVRRENDYSHAVACRDRLFRDITLDGFGAKVGPDILNPYWGDYGCLFPFNHGFIPDETVETFGVPSLGDSFAVVDQIAADVDVPRQQTASSLVALAKRSFPAAIDTLWGAAFADQTLLGSEGTLVSLARQAIAYSEKVPNPPWLSQVSSDQQFIDLLLYEIAKESGSPAVTESFGSTSVLANQMKQAARTLGQRVLAAATGPAAPAVKRQMLLRFSRFFGDVFFYIKERQQPIEARPIRGTVVDILRAAHKAKMASGTKLIIVGHSMGGNIVYDMLTHTASDVHCDVLLTVGSQVGLFEELKMFDSSSETIPGEGGRKVPRPSNIGAWLNVYDSADPFGYATKRIFENTWDFEFDTGAGMLSSHSAYFYKPSFHRRLNAHLKQVLP